MHDVPDVLDALVDDLDIGFAELVRTYEPVVLSVALRVSGRTAEAEELASESFLRSYLALRGYEPSRILALRPRPWLITIMLNIWRNNVRTASRRPQQISMADPPEKPSAGASVEEQVEQLETRRELTELVALLPENQRLAVVLRHFVGLPIAEIANAMHLSEGTAKSHVSRGLRALRDLCGDHRQVGSVAPSGGVGAVHPLSPGAGS
jgi:RNA polymerase sigma-70 factor (ECF subfamily)